MARLPLPTRLVRENLAIYFNSSVLRHSIIRTRREAFLVGPTRAAGYSTKRLLLPPAHSSCKTRCLTFGPNCLFYPTIIVGLLFYWQWRPCEYPV